MRKKLNIFFAAAYILQLIMLCMPLHVEALPSLGILRRHNQEAVIEREYPFANPGALTVLNLEGNIRIETEWRSSVALRAVKRAGNQEQLDLISIEKYCTEKDGRTNLSISTNYANTQVDGSVDYTLIIPMHANLRLRTGTGSINVKDVQGSIVAQARMGNIEIERITGPVCVCTKERGNITVDHVSGGIKAATIAGTITIESASKSVIATSTHGDIAVNFRKLPEASRVVVHSQSGKVTVGLPSTFNAHIIGKSDGAKITSDHYIALRQSTPLEKEISAYCDELARRICRCSEGGEKSPQATEQTVPGRMRSVLARTLKYLYPFKKNT